MRDVPLACSLQGKVGSVSTATGSLSAVCCSPKSSTAVRSATRALQVRALVPARRITHTGGSRQTGRHNRPVCCQCTRRALILQGAYRGCGCTAPHGVEEHSGLG